MNTSQRRFWYLLSWLFALLLSPCNLATAQSLHEQRCIDHNFVGINPATPHTQSAQAQQPVVQASLGFVELADTPLRTQLVGPSSVLSLTPRSRGSIPTVDLFEDEPQLPTPKPVPKTTSSQKSSPKKEELAANPLTMIREPVLESYVSPILTDIGAPGPQRVWLDGESLIWWLQDAPIPPLVTRDFGDVAPEGALTNPGTRVLLGDEIDNGPFYGFRGRFGGWVDHQQVFGLEVSGFTLFEQSRTFRFNSGPDGNPPLSFPIFAANLGREGSFLISNPNVPGPTIVIPPPMNEGPEIEIPTFGALVGGVDITHSTELWGMEVLARCKLIAKPHCKLHLLTGFAYLDLDEELTIAYAGRNVLLDQNLAFRDQFETRNQFYGGQLGAHLILTHKRLQFDLLGKVALGTTNQSVNIYGNTITSGTGVANPGTFLGGLYTQPTNIGVENQNDFTVVPQAQAKFSVRVLPRLRLFAGYGFMYWSSVVRPGDQIDRGINTNQPQGGILTGVARPAPGFQRSGFWAHGLNFGAMVTY